MNLPAAFQEEMKALLKEDYASYEESFQKPRVYGLRVNSVQSSSGKNFEKSALFPAPGALDGKWLFITIPKIRWPNILIITPDFIIFRSQVPWYLLPGCQFPEETECWTCAPPRGRKSTELAARLDGSGILVSNRYQPLQSHRPFKESGTVRCRKHSGNQCSTGRPGRIFPGIF